jgi:acyl-CoA synthetase (AMP-forming)/AMP-acid ligase II
VSDLISAAPLLDASPLGDLSRFGDRPALITRDATLSYLELAARVRETAEALGATRRLVMVTATNTVDAAVAYLAALSGGHPVLLLPPDPSGHAGSVLAAYDPDVMFRDGAAGWELVERREGTAHDLHPDLALLLSTSGSTGSPKLVRLSRENVRSNAESIASALGIQGSDRAATTLPIHYCYGLSVINSHLLSGAGLILTDLSVLDSCFWDLFGSAGGTTFAGVPYTFDLLEQCGFADQELPSLRYVTQAGGRLDPDGWRTGPGWAPSGWDLYVMYGQTEATARMAILPPDLALEHPEAIGGRCPAGASGWTPRPVSCSTRRQRDDGLCAGSADLAEGPGVHELRTGDLARPSRRRASTRSSAGAAASPSSSASASISTRWSGSSRRRASRAAASSTMDASTPLSPAMATSSRRSRCWQPGPDSLCTRCRRRTCRSTRPRPPARPTTRRWSVRPSCRVATRSRASGRGPASASELRDLYAELLGRPDATEDSSFVSLGGDSLSYVEVSVRLADRLDTLPRAWHTMTPRELARPSGTTTGRWGSLLETTVLLRAVAILLIVGTHTELFTLYGGAHILLGVAGYNFARFQLGEQSRGALTRRGLGALGQVAVPSMLWIAGVGVLTGMYVPATAVFLNGALGSDTWTVQWQFWFLEALVWSVLASVALLAVPQLYRLERRAPWEFALGVLGVGLALRFALVGIQAARWSATPCRWSSGSSRSAGLRPRRRATGSASWSRWSRCCRCPASSGHRPGRRSSWPASCCCCGCRGCTRPARSTRWPRRSLVRRCTSI